MKRITYLLLIVIFVVAAHVQTLAQDKQEQQEKEIIQVSGLVVEGDSMLAIPGVHIFSPRTGTGASTNLLGFFTVPVEAGDSLIIAAVGFKKQQIAIPSDTSGSYNLIIQMQKDTLFLPRVEISTFPTQEFFKQAFLAIQLDNQDDLTNMNNNLNDQIMSRLLATSEMDGSLNHTYYMQQQVRALENQYMRTTVPFLDPFAWSRFIKAVKAEQKKKKEKKRKEQNDSPY